MGKEMAREAVYRYLSDKILNNDIKSGESLVEEEIAKTLNVSRTPVREVLTQLESEGLVIRIPNRGVFVREITMQDIIEICDLRQMFEVYCLKDCIDNILDDDIAEMKKTVTAVDSEENAEAYFENTESVHRVITAFCTNQRVKEFLRLIDRQEEHMRRSLKTLPNRVEKVRDHHLYLIQVIEERDLEKAEQALSEHLDRVKDSLIKAYIRRSVEMDFSRDSAAE